MSDLKIAVIVPCHNSELYVGATLDRLMRQDFPFKYKVFAVDDVSTDGTLDILKRYQALFPDKLEVLSCPSGNLPQARNTAFDKALEADYVAFSDSDDLPSFSFLSVLYQTVTTSGADCASLGYRVLKEGEKAKPARCPSFSAPLSGYEAARLILSDQKIKSYVWCKIFSSKLLREKKIRFVEERFVYEDLVFSFQTFLSSKKVALNDTPVYDYLIRKGSLSHNPTEQGYLMHLCAYACCRVWADKELGAEKAKQLFTNASFTLGNKLAADIFPAAKKFGKNLPHALRDAFERLDLVCGKNFDPKDPLWADYISKLPL